MAEAVLALLFLASAAYAVFGGAYQAAPTPEAAITMAAAVLERANPGGAPRNESASGGSAKPADHLPAGHANRGRDGDGNAVTSEHN